MYYLILTLNIAELIKVVCINKEKCIDEKITSSKGTILIVEDDPLIAQLYKDVFEKYNYTVLAIAKNGKEAISMYKRFLNKPDITILDFHLPEKNGLEVIDEILAINYPTEIVMISASTSLNRETILAKGVNFISKPTNINRILEELNGIGSF